MSAPAGMKWVLASGLLLAAAVGCDGGEAGAGEPDAAAPADAARPDAGPTAGLVVEAGGYSIAAYCDGPVSATRPMVVFVNGLGGPYFAWVDVVEELVADTRVCLFDRPGVGASEAPREPMSVERNAVILEEVIDAVRGDEQVDRVVLVAHSIGGSIAFPYARDHAGQVAGLILLDATPPGFGPAILALIPEDETGPAAGIRQTVLDMAEGDNVERLVFVDVEGAEAGAPGDLPLWVLTHREDLLDGVAGPEYADAVGEAWSAGQETWAALSTAGALTVTDAGHLIFVDELALTVDTIRAALGDAP